MMEEQLAANRRQMDEMEKSWEQRLKETKEAEKIEAVKRRQDEEVRLQGTPHLVNLNEDPFLDRKVVYDIQEQRPLTCGRRGKGVTHKLQLGGTGIQPNHAQFERTGEGVRVKPLDEKAMPHIRVNGKLLETIEGAILKPNDRICIGPSALFLFKNKSNEAMASMLDSKEDPISFEFAYDEVLSIINETEM